MHQKPTRRSTEPVFTEPQRLHKVLAQCGYGSLRGLEELIIAGRITVNRQPAEVGQKVGPNDQIRINGELVRLRSRKDVLKTVGVEDRLCAHLAQFPPASARKVVAIGKV